MANGIAFLRCSALPLADRVDAGWSSPVARQAHNLKVTGSNPVPATNHQPSQDNPSEGFCLSGSRRQFLAFEITCEIISAAMRASRADRKALDAARKEGRIDG